MPKGKSQVEDQPGQVDQFLAFLDEGQYCDCANKQQFAHADCGAPLEFEVVALDVEVELAPVARYVHQKHDAHGVQVSLLLHAILLKVGLNRPVRMLGQLHIQNQNDDHSRLNHTQTKQAAVQL